MHSIGAKKSLFTIHHESARGLVSCFVFRWPVGKELAALLACMKVAAVHCSCRDQINHATVLQRKQIAHPSITAYLIATVFDWTGLEWGAGAVPQPGWPKG